MGINRYGVDAVVLKPYDLEPHFLTLKLDVHGEVAWRAQVQFPIPKYMRKVHLKTPKTTFSHCCVDGFASGGVQCIQ